MCSFSVDACEGAAGADASLEAGQWTSPTQSSTVPNPARRFRGRCPVAEKLGRLKPNGQLHGYSPLSRVIELEGLYLGISGKLPRLAARAERQRTEVESLQSAAAKLI